ncbi:MAG: DUF3553 domain-containing protein [Planctomycetota bacterium]|jgi:hypothetical protein
MMSKRKFESGDRVRHVRRPEWGIGSVIKTEESSAGGTLGQRVSVRFPNGGLKTVSTAHADLELVNGPGEPDEAEASFAGWEKMNDAGWLGPLARRKVEEVMVSLPPEVRDPFDSLRKRLVASLDLYRFEPTGRSLIDWAIAQTGLTDPLSRFTRHELEQLFEPWAAERDNHLLRLLKEAKSELDLIRELVGSAPRAGQEAVRRLTATR